MPPSARATAQRQSPTYVPGGVTTANVKTMDTSGFAKLPTLPTLDTGRLFDGGFRLKNISQQIEGLGNKYNPYFTQAQAQAKQGLAGLGGWRFKQDDPSTAGVDESLQLEKDNNAPPGEREVQAVNAERFGANQAGLLHSSFAQKNIGNALQRLSLEAQAVVNQYSSQLMNISSQWSTDQQNLTTAWVTQYGEDFKWLAENPPPLPADWSRSYSEIAGLSPGQASQVHLSYTDAPVLSELEKMYPGFTFQTRRGVIGNGVEGWITDAIRNADPGAAVDPSAEIGTPTATDLNWQAGAASTDRNQYQNYPRSPAAGSQWGQDYPIGGPGQNQLVLGKDFGRGMTPGQGAQTQLAIAQKMGVRPEDIVITQRKDGTWIAAVRKSAR